MSSLDDAVRKLAAAPPLVHFQNQRTGAAMLCGPLTTGRLMGGVDTVTCLGCLEVLAAAGVVRLLEFGKVVERNGVRRELPGVAVATVPRPIEGICGVWYVKVRNKGEKVFLFLSSQAGNLNRLRVHAVPFRSAEAAQRAHDEIERENPGVEAIVTFRMTDRAGNP